MSEQRDGFKVRDVGTSRISAREKYQQTFVGQPGLWALVKYEALTLLLGGLGGALGLVLRKRFYRYLFGAVGKNVLIGKNVTLRHPHKIRLGDNVIIDDNCVLDAKGSSNEGITLGSGVFLGRNTIVYTKNGDISLGEGVNIGANCNLYSKGTLDIRRHTVIAAYCYVMCGGQYDYRSEVPFSQQSSRSAGATVIHENCWLGAKVVVTDNVEVGADTVVAAGAVVTAQLPEKVIAGGVPAKTIKPRFES